MGRRRCRSPEQEGRVSRRARAAGMAVRARLPDSRRLSGRVPGFSRLRVRGCRHAPQILLRVRRPAVRMTRLTILMYHRVGEVPLDSRHPKNFVPPRRLGEHLEALLSWGYQPITFDDWMRYRAGESGVPRRPFIATFDDGYADFDDAWPILR